MAREAAPRPGMRPGEAGLCLLLALRPPGGGGCGCETGSGETATGNRPRSAAAGSAIANRRRSAGVVARRCTGVLTAGRELRGRSRYGVAGNARQRGLETVMEAKARRRVPAFVRILALVCVRQSMLETLHRGATPITRTGDYSDVVVVDAEGRRIPWPEVSRFDENEMRDLMREIVNKLYTFFVKGEDPDFVAWTDFVRPQSYHWDRPKIDKVLMHFVKEYARVRRKKG